jgi:Ricin-type beta-trefoil lectin domain
VWLPLFTAVGFLAFSAQNACHATQIIGVGGKCLDVARGSTTNGTNVEIWHCGTRSPNQRWILSGQSVVGIGDKCLDVTGGGSANGTRVQMWDCKPGSPNQRWTYHDGQLIGIDHKCLDVAGGNTDNGTLVVLWDCHGGPNQTWSLRPSVIGP